MASSTCTHTDQIQTVTPSAQGCEECLKTGESLGSPEALPHLWPCGLLQQLKKQARSKALRPDPPPHYSVFRTGRRLAVVLHR